MQAMNFRGRWVLVTGASSGLGRTMARSLAIDHQANLVIVARRFEKLQELKSEIQAASDVQIEVIVADLSNIEDVKRLLETALAQPLYAAILNAGVTHFGPYGELEWGAFEAMLSTNVTSVVRMTTELIPHLEKQSGGIMLVASMAGMTPLPYQAAYSGTKAFLVHFGCALWHELKGRQVSITTYAPGGVVTEMTAGENFSGLRKWLMPVDRAAREGLNAFKCRKYLYIPGATNRLGLLLMKFLPRRLITSQIGTPYRRSLTPQLPTPPK